MQVSLFILLGVLIVPDHGLIGIAWVSAIVTFLGNVARLIHVRVLIGIQPFGPTFFKPVVATLVAAVPLAAAKLVDSFAVDVASLGAAAVLFLLALRLLGLDPQETHVFEQLRDRLKALRKRPR
jgi:hypothetical protein